MARLKKAFYRQINVVEIARQLLGKVLVTNIDGEKTAGIICETEAYEGIVDKASHAYGGRRTDRTETMYLEGGFTYVYLCYGIHELFNVLTHDEGTPHAVLIRGIIPLEGIEIMQLRKGNKWNKKSGIGPGNVSKCLGISRKLNAIDLSNSKLIYIEDRNIIVPENEIKITPRIGVDYAEDHALWPYRFVWERVTA